MSSNLGYRNCHTVCRALYGDAWLKRHSCTQLQKVGLCIPLMQKITRGTSYTKVFRKSVSMCANVLLPLVEGLVFSMLLHLNIFCTSLKKPYCTKIRINLSTLITVVHHRWQSTLNYLVWRREAARSAGGDDDVWPRDVQSAQDTACVHQCLCRQHDRHSQSLATSLSIS